MKQKIEYSCSMNQLKKRFDEVGCIKLDKFYTVSCIRKGDDIEVTLDRGTGMGSRSCGYDIAITDGELLIKKRVTFDQTVMFALLIIEEVILNLVAVLQIVYFFKNAYALTYLIIAFLMWVLAFVVYRWFMKIYVWTPQKVFNTFIEKLSSEENK